MAAEDQAKVIIFEKYFNRNWDQLLDKITINDLLVQAIIGVNAKERNNPQKIILNVTIYTDTSEAGETDNIKKTIDYSQVCRRIYAYTESAKLFTLEALAHQVARICIFEVINNLKWIASSLTGTEFDHVFGVRVKVEKPSALPLARCPSVEILRTRQWFEDRGIHTTATPKPKCYRGASDPILLLNEFSTVRLHVEHWRNPSTSPSRPLVFVMLSVSWFAVLPLVTIAVAKFTPSLVFPAPPSSDGAALLRHCKKLGDRYLTASVLIFALVFGLAMTLIAPPNLPHTTAERVAYVLKLEVFPLLFYAICIFRVAMRRSEDPNAVLGQRVGVSPAVEIASRVLQNTTEQLLLGIFSHLALSVVLAPSHTAILPGLVSLWLCGRILFVLGYTPENPMAREFGFDLTIVPSVASLVWASILSVHALLFG